MHAVPCCLFGLCADMLEHVKKIGIEEARDIKRRARLILEGRSQTDEDWSDEDWSVVVQRVANYIADSESTDVADPTQEEWLNCAALAAIFKMIGPGGGFGTDSTGAAAFFVEKPVSASYHTLWQAPCPEPPPSLPTTCYYSNLFWH